MSTHQTANTEERRCKFCNVILSDENQYLSMRERNSFVCKKCHNERTVKWQKENKDRCNANGRHRYIDNIDKDMDDLGKVCIVCGTPITNDNIRDGNKAKCYYICNTCEKSRNAENYKNDPTQKKINSKKWCDANPDKCRETSRRWRQNNLEKSREIVIRHQRKIGMKPMNENKECGIFLGVYVAEGVLSKVFNNVERMPFGNVGYDFICSNNKKIDVKSSCIGVNGNWSFRINMNDIADYFVLIAFDNRDDLNPMHLWMIPGGVLNNRISVSTMPSTMSKWDAYKLPLDKVVECCDSMRNV